MDEMKVFVTKYALTKGLFEETVEVGPGDAKYVYSIGRWRAQYILGVTAFRTREQAIENARGMARRKVQSLHKQITKLERLVKTPNWSADK